VFSPTLSFYFGRHFARIVTSLFALVLFIITLATLFEFINRGLIANATAGLALTAVALLRVPSTGEETLPFVVLYGSIAAFVIANRRLEVVVARAAGVSAWQFLLPAAAVGLTVGILATTVYNPIAASLLAQSNQLASEVFVKTQSAAATDVASQAVWLRQRGGGTDSIIGALRSFDDGLSLSGVSAFVFDADGTFRERVDAATARYGAGEWQLQDATVTASGSAPQKVALYHLATDLSPGAIQQTFQQVESVPFWTLPGLADAARRAGVPADRYDLQFQALLSRPILLLAMVLIAANVSLRFSRSRSLGPMIVTGVAVGFMLYVVMKIARDLGSGGIVPPPLAAWLPAAIAILVGVTVLLQLEDG
jgi:lipopolysaccharide export system permease protein